MQGIDLAVDIGAGLESSGRHFCRGDVTIPDDGFAIFGLAALLLFASLLFLRFGEASLAEDVLSGAGELAEGCRDVGAGAQQGGGRPVVGGELLLLLPFGVEQLDTDVLGNLVDGDHLAADGALGHARLCFALGCT